MLNLTNIIVMFVYYLIYYVMNNHDIKILFIDII